MLDTIVTHHPKQINTFVASDYTLGKQLYAAGELIDACRNDEQVKGFKAVMFAEADAETGFWLRAHKHVDCDEPEYRYLRSM